MILYICVIYSVVLCILLCKVKIIFTENKINKMNKNNVWFVLYLLHIFTGCHILLYQLLVDIISSP